MEGLQPIAGLFFLSLLVEGTIEYFVVEPLKKARKPTWFVRYIALAAGIAAAFGFRADLTTMHGGPGSVRLGGLYRYRLGHRPGFQLFERRDRQVQAIYLNGRTLLRPQYPTITSIKSLDSTSAW